MRYLLDTNVLVAAFRSINGASNAIVRRALLGDLPLIVHQKLVFEYRDVLSRPDILAETGLAWADIEVVLAHLVAGAHEVEVRYLWRPNLKDEGDNFNSGNCRCGLALHYCDAQLERFCTRRTPLSTGCPAHTGAVVAISDTLVLLCQIAL